MQTQKLPTTNGKVTSVPAIAAPGEPVFLETDLAAKPAGNFWRRWSLRTKATVVAVLLGLIPIVPIVTISQFIASREANQAAKDNQESLLISFSSLVRNFMLERYDDALKMQSIEIFDEPVLRKAASLERKVDRLQDLVGEGEIYDSVAVIDLYGRVEAQYSLRDPIADNYSKQAHYQTALKTQKIAISNPIKEPSSGKYSIDMAIPILDEGTKKVSGVIVARVPMSNIEKSFASIKAQLAGRNQVFEETDYHILDNNGPVIIASEAQVGGDIYKDIPLATQLHAAGKLNSVEGTDTSTPDRLLISYALVPQIAGLPDFKWAVLLHRDIEKALAGERRQLQAVGIATAIAAVAAILLAAYLARRATKPILEITDAVKAIGEGDLATRIATVGEDELAQLGGNVNEMAGQLQAFLVLQEAESQRTNILAEISRAGTLAELIVPLERYLEDARTYLKCDRVVVYRLVYERSGEVIAEAALPVWVGAVNAGLSDPCIPQSTLDTYKLGRVVPTSDVFQAGFHPKHEDLMRRLQVKSNLVVPILRAGEVDGLLIAHHCAAKHDWQPNEISFLTDRAERLGQALAGLATLEQQRLLSEQERQRSETLQRELIDLLSDVEGAASGDLTVRAQISAGEIGIVADFFNAIIESLRDVVSQVKRSTEQVTGSVSTNDVVMRHLAEEAQEQAKQIEATLRSVEQMTNSIQEVARSAEQAATVSKTAETTAEAGGAAIARTVDSIGKLRDTVGETAKKVKRLGEASQQISRVVTLIDQIALKTNMLAVNASIEAARAGEEGRGFAVVAEEVGALAAQSATATKEIGRIVESIQLETGEVVEAMEASTTQVVEGTQQVEEAKKSLEQIVQVARQVNQLFQSISAATMSQVSASNSVKELMQSVAEVSQRSSTTSQDVSETLQETLGIAQKLKTSVETFKVGV